MGKKSFVLYIIKYESAKKLKFIDELQNLFDVKLFSFDNAIENRKARNLIRRFSRLHISKTKNIYEKYNLSRDMSVKHEASIIINSMLMHYMTERSSRHPMRTKLMLKLLADEAIKRNLYTDVLSPENNIIISNAALFHDLGKLDISPSILTKSGKLTPEEYEIIKTHTTKGRDMMLSCKNIITCNEKQVKFFSEIIYSHHEHWDGSGYPQGLRGEEIPVSARLMAIADVYDAMTSKRIYKEAYSHEETIKTVLMGSGTHFDPLAVELFLNLQNKFRDIASYYRDK
ncbi:HD domain-containing phosphohydrolase [Sedimentibacter sp.]|uniref:HD-GYP domain-containing protein n=1 Tax=Sedimentibacter sp. TaxID=1960295 RepID=UPI00289D8769|nr:HD domain-containing phosphohydrolase [Sedimentibacter sp.]